MIKRTITFPNNQVLKRSAAIEFVQVANRFEARIMIEHQDKIVNAKSMLGLLSLGTMGGGDMLLTVDGVDEVQAAEAICQAAEEAFK